MPSNPNSPALHGDLVNHPRPRTLALLGAMVLVSVVGCSDDPPTAEEARKDRIQDRLSQTFSDQQVRCIVDQLDDTVLQALDLGEALESDSDELGAYTEVVAVCVTDPNGTTTSSAPPPTTTTTEAPDATEGEEEPAPDEDAATDGEGTDAATTDETAPEDPDAG